MQVRRGHPCLASAQMDRHAVGCAFAGAAAGRIRDRPEQAVRVGLDPRVEVVNLGGEVLEVEPTSVEVKSNESERAFVFGAIHADVDTLHKPHIGVEEQRLDAAVGICGGSLPTHVCDTDKAVEVGDR